MKKSILLALTASVAYGQIETGAPCSTTMPSNGGNGCCYQDKKTAVMGGVDFVDLAHKKQGKDGAVFGKKKIHPKTKWLLLLFLDRSKCGNVQEESLVVRARLGRLLILGGRRGGRKP